MKKETGKTLLVLTGAGFSKPAGLPIAKEIDDFFTRDNRNNILSFSSGEKMWVDFASERWQNRI
jgi:NAD-dependent SIR2 family protein deacetylase